MIFCNVRFAAKLNQERAAERSFMSQALLAEEAVVQEILEVLGDVSLDDYCGSEGRYRNWEEKVAEPRLKVLGYEVHDWITTDGDSFGPLCREVHCSKDGRAYTFWYG